MFMPVSNMVNKKLISFLVIWYWTGSILFVSEVRNFVNKPMFAKNKIVWR